MQRPSSDELSTEVLERTLGSGMGRPFRFFEEVTSTNTVALGWARQGAPEGALVTTDHQTAGRGRWSRSWLSFPGALLQFSLVLRPRLRPHDVGLVTTAVGVACAEAIESLSGLSTTIKWPNDVRIRGRKVGGILVESQLAGASFEAVVAGVGINVGWTAEQIPEEIRATATSIAAELAVERRTEPHTGLAERQAGAGAARGTDGLPPRVEILGEILAALERRYRTLPRSAPALLAEATRRSDVIGSWVRVRFADGREVDGRAQQLTTWGALELATPDGLVAVNVGEVEQLRPDREPR